MPVRALRGVWIAFVGASLGCPPTRLAHSPEPPAASLDLYEVVLRTLTARLPPDKRPPVEPELIAWRAHYDSTAGAVDVHPPADFRILPDTFLARLARAGVIGGICAPDTCPRVPLAVTLSAPNAHGGVVRVQVTLAGIGVMQYWLRREPKGWTVVDRHQLVMY